jgi:hypothetical protein
MIAAHWLMPKGETSMPSPPAASMTPIVDGGKKSDVLLVFF